MSLLDKVFSLVTGNRHTPVGTVRVVDPGRLNWLWVTYNTVEELVRVAPDGSTVPAAMKSYAWADDRTLDLTLRQGNRFPDGELLNSAIVKRAFDEVLRWQSPHPPGTQFNLEAGTRCEVTGEFAVRLHLPNPDAGALGKLRAVHLMSTRFWGEVGFGYARHKSGEGHW